MYAACRQFNISPKTGYQTLGRYRAEGEKGLRDRSRAPSAQTVALLQGSRTGCPCPYERITLGGTVEELLHILNFWVPQSCPRRQLSLRSWLAMAD
ncbi:helix-turn-helix domain-containing protein [Bradyrhizobium sp. JYMT SZCCT0428]|uniref:helix-turn-helix domain-containing protein n=1 Tax=Bradyrhizobium sp. JYMT SZCCT0428 TaxID=2807673 RepID=UPI003908A2CE